MRQTQIAPLAVTKTHQELVVTEDSLVSLEFVLVADLVDVWEHAV
jgi:hypothetical protein